VDQIERAWDGNAWHGPPLRKILRGVTPRQAFRRPLPGAHTIAELVLHLGSWVGAAAESLDGARMPAVTPMFNWPRLVASTARTWRLAVDRLERAHRLLVARARRFPERRLRAIVPGRKYNFYVLLHGIVQHNLYHAGQIALLKKG
jgi:hypothetical protein